MTDFPSSSERRLVVLDVVGLSGSLLGGHTPRLNAFAARHGGARPFRPAFPAVTTTAQSTFLTGRGPGEHGIVGNGWYDRELCEVQFWKQPDPLVHGEKIWHRLRRARPEATVAKLFWWYNMFGQVDWSITPRPLYFADGSKEFDIHTQPPELRFEIQRGDALGRFPFPAFWGPRAGIGSSEWIAAGARWVEERHRPTLSLVYLPHLDYPLQKLGPDHPQIPAELAAVDALVGELIDWFEGRGVQVIVLSEYGISPVRTVVYPNRLLREQGWLQVKPERNFETLDPGGSRAFAVCDHQIAHVYLNDPQLREPVRQLFAATAGVERVDTPESLGWHPHGVGGERAGDLVLLARPDAWFAYYHWLDGRKAPDYARTVDIHRKPGYDPCELFLDPGLVHPKLAVASFLARKKLGLRALLKVIPLRPELVRGSHGHPDPGTELWPVALGPEAARVNQPRAVFEWMAGLLGC